MTQRVYKAVCAWCNAYLGGPRDGPVTHTICQRCADLQLVALGIVPDADPWAAWQDVGGEGGGA